MLAYRTISNSPALYLPVQVSTPDKMLSR